jgi:predicted Zn-dependent protease
LRLSVVTGPGNRHFLLQYASKDASAGQRASAGLAEAEASMRAMTAADRAAARPHALRVMAMPRGGFAELARQSGGLHSESRLRLLNGVYGSGPEPAPGAPVKVIH